MSYRVCPCDCHKGASISHPWLRRREPWNSVWRVLNRLRWWTFVNEPGRGLYRRQVYFVRRSEET